MLVSITAASMKVPSSVLPGRCYFQKPAFCNRLTFARYEGRSSERITGRSPWWLTDLKVVHLGNHSGIHQENWKLLVMAKQKFADVACQWSC